MRTLSAQQVQEKREHNETCMLINTLDEEHFSQTKIPGAINIPQSSDDFAERVEQEAGRKDREIIVYCANTECQSSKTAAHKLEGAGFTNVYDFEAGAKGWRESGQPLVTS